MAAPFVYRFEWDPQKARENAAKHGVTFELAATVFCDPLALSVYDEEHSASEERWVTLGLAGNARLLVVVHTFVETDAGTTVRIISAREATRGERQDYDNGRQAR